MTQPPAPAMGPNQMPATWDLVAPGFAEEAAPHSVRYAARALELVPPEAAHRVLDVAAGSG
ncbi:MAG: SAM-dependent methyltransferase, partial [Deltaproteobacteria bacterium]|nr:SAM-dependent methyltransferase [Deltaproteobacteria bacterium]